MFVKAIENVSRFTRPICFVERLNNDELIPGSATIFFVNDEGVAITCKHVVNTLIGYEKIQRKKKEEKPVVAICYDFDKTLSPDDMQAQGYIQSVEYDVPDFWKESNALAETNDMDQNLAYMYKMKKEAEGRVLFTKKNLEDYGSKVRLFPGVEDWFDRIKKYGKNKETLHCFIQCNVSACR